MSISPVIKVFICNLLGEYLSRDGLNWSFTTDRTKARIFDYAADHVADKLAMAWREGDAVWVAVQVAQEGEGETCDGCARKLRYTDIQFDGARYLCPQCRK
jgi:hypothetical protein